MSELFHRISRRAALADLRDLPLRLSQMAACNKAWRGGEGKSIQAQAARQLRWHLLFRTLNRRAKP